MKNILCRHTAAGFSSLFALICVLVMGGALTSYASKTDLVTVASDKQKNDPTIVLTQGMAEVVDIKGPVADVMVANPDVVVVTALQSNRLYLVGGVLGTTNLIAVDDAGDVIKRLNVRVKIDDEELEDTLQDLFPEEEVRVRATRGQVVLAGSVSTPDVANRIRNIAAQYLSSVLEGGDPESIMVNMLDVRGESQVTLRVRLLEVSRSLLKERGAETDITDIGGVLGDDVQNSQQILDGSVFGRVVSSGVTETPFATFGLLESVGAFGPIDTAISLLEEEGLAKVLAEPNLTAISGETAGFLAGGEIPVPAGRDSEGNIIITFRDFGVSLNFSPTVLSSKRISLQLDTEVSSLSRDNQVTLTGVEVPGLDIRRAATTVEMGSGSTLMIAGLIQSDTVNTLSGLPGARNAPVIGQLMSSDSFRRNETELVVLVTPYLVKPFADRKQAKLVDHGPKGENLLASAFATNIRRTYGKLQIAELLDGQEYGYILD